MKVTYIHPKREQIQELSRIQLTILVRMIGFNLVERMLFEKLKIGKLCLFSGKLMSDLLYPTAKSLKQSQRVNFIYIKDSLELDRCLCWDRHRLGAIMTVDKISHSVSPPFVLTNVSYSVNSCPDTNIPSLYWFMSDPQVDSNPSQHS